MPNQPTAAQPAAQPAAGLLGANPATPAQYPRIGGFAPGVQPAAFDPNQIQATDSGSNQAGNPRLNWLRQFGGTFAGDPQLPTSMGGGLAALLDQFKNSYDGGSRVRDPMYRGGLLGRFG